MSWSHINKFHHKITSRDFSQIVSSAKMVMLSANSKFRPNISYLQKGAVHVAEKQCTWSIMNYLTINTIKWHNILLHFENMVRSVRTCEMALLITTSNMESRINVQRPKIHFTISTFRSKLFSHFTAQNLQSLHSLSGNN